MRRRPTLAAVAALCSILFLVAGCGGDDTGEDGPETTSTLATDEGPIECPAPETSEAEGLQCDAEGNVTPVAEEGGDGSEGGTVEECPSPEVLEAEGFACDAEGQLTPLDEETVGECPSPETLEAEGFTCDAEGNLTPIAGADGEDAVPSEEPVECPAPEVLEAEGYTCDENGVLTPAGG